MRLITLIIVFSFCVKQLVADKTCNNFEKCGSCIGFAGDACVWCSQPNITDRCQSKIFYISNEWCDEKFVYNPQDEPLKLYADEPLRPAKGKIPAVQFRPQKIRVKLRPSSTAQFTMSFEHAIDFPLDVYYLMDYSYTMRNYVKQLKDQSTLVKEQLTNFTNNVRFGLGSFIEKPDYPFVGEKNQAYAFRNHLSLTTNLSRFDEILSEERDFSNLDLPEAGLDALMQAMACVDGLGWRPNVRRIIVLCTDATYHSAGDGKFVLAYHPNDMKCHLNTSNYYDYSLIQDYPSVSQVNKIATEGNFRIIFATVRALQYTYNLLAQQITGAKSASLVPGRKSDSNIFNIIKSVYLESIRFVTMRYIGKWPPYVQLILTPDCTVMNSKECIMGHRESIEMKATLKVTCPPKSSDSRHVLQIGPVDGGPNDMLTIDLEIDCQCSCEKDNSSGVRNSPYCSNFGTHQCGICYCNKERYGDTCQCNGNVTSNVDLEKCKNANDTKFCSGRGTCLCGKCTCSSGFSGDYCEFDDNSCKRRGNKLCSGNGRCTHGACECNTYWYEDDCGCSMHNDNCFAPYSQEICSGKGDCRCNECVCHVIEGKEEKYSGIFCDDCEECAKKRCKELENYARCNYEFNKTHCDTHGHTFNTDVIKLNKSEINTSKWPTAKWCSTKLDKDRTIVFIHVYDKNEKKLVLVIQTEAEEAPKANIWIPVGIAIGTVVLIGLLTVLVWKLLVDAMDEKEYSKFMEQAKSEGFDVSENPIYQPASVNFSNPTYNVMENTQVDNRE